MRQIAAMRVYGVALLLLILDRVFKSIAFSTAGKSTVIIPDVFSFSYVLNQRAALSLPIPMLLYALAFLGVIFFATTLWIRSGGMRITLLRYAGALILIGAVSNLYDRLRYGGVIDMLFVPGLGACNIADILIIVGIGLWLIHEYRTQDKTSVLDSTRKST